MGSMAFTTLLLIVCVAFSVAQQNAIPEDLLSDNEIEAWVISLRRDLHTTPELMFKETVTSAKIQTALRALDIDFKMGYGRNTKPDRIEGLGGTGVIADIGTGKSPTVLLRADMDGLPIDESKRTDLEFRSTHPGRMHACGHDGHTSMLLGAARVLKAMEGNINGTVRLMFQPAEEGGAGGKRMRDEGILEMEPAVERVVLAACDRFQILIHGVGGHAAMPHLTKDPIVATAAMVQGFQTIISRGLHPLESGVVSVTKLEGGSALNVIPSGITMWGTVRALSTETLVTLMKRVETVGGDIAKSYGCNITVTWSPDFYPPTDNDKDLWDDFASGVAAQVSETKEYANVVPTMGAEDFGFIAERVPSAFYLLGQGSAPGTDYGLHHPMFSIDESVLMKGVELHVRSALGSLEDLWQKREEALKARK
ncbi:hypothetical protein TrRE_jg7537 [Triparma retinervis]|uniref:Peptidase M20 dimerisation domain-containing protein n=1 Tax=Triparma retinervis TaxID=2557542 RepID=A0A9W7E7E1_9STRA|nr:hypothetical protein TrRE_jg7537 [Triparma retinervis]